MHNRSLPAGLGEEQIACGCRASSVFDEFHLAVIEQNLN